MVEACFAQDEARAELGDKIKTQELLGFLFYHVFSSDKSSIETVLNRFPSGGVGQRQIPWLSWIPGNEP